MLIIIFFAVTHTLRDVWFLSCSQDDAAKYYVAADRTKKRGGGKIKGTLESHIIITSYKFTSKRSGPEI
jgi:hypothetical protein